MGNWVDFKVLRQYVEKSGERSMKSHPIGERQRDENGDEGRELGSTRKGITGETQACCMPPQRVLGMSPF